MTTSLCYNMDMGLSVLGQYWLSSATGNSATCPGGDGGWKTPDRGWNACSGEVWQLVGGMPGTPVRSGDSVWITMWNGAVHRRNNTDGAGAGLDMPITGGRTQNPLGRWIIYAKDPSIDYLVAPPGVVIKSGMQVAFVSPFNGLGWLSSQGSLMMSSSPGAMHTGTWSSCGNETWTVRTKSQSVIDVCGSHDSSQAEALGFHCNDATFVQYALSEIGNQQYMDRIHAMSASSDGSQVSTARDYYKLRCLANMDDECRSTLSSQSSAGQYDDFMAKYSALHPGSKEQLLACYQPLPDNVPEPLKALVAMPQCWNPQCNQSGAYQTAPIVNNHTPCSNITVCTQNVNSLQNTTQNYTSNIKQDCAGAGSTRNADIPNGTLASSSVVTAVASAAAAAAASAAAGAGAGPASGLAMLGPDAVWIFVLFAVIVLVAIMLARARGGASAHHAQDDAYAPVREQSADSYVSCGKNCGSVYGDPRRNQQHLQHHRYPSGAGAHQ